MRDTTCLKDTEYVIRDTPHTPDWTHSFTLPRFLLLIGLFLFALYPEVILGTHSFFDRDFGLFTYPVAHYTREQLWQGHIPLWNPLSDCGLPFLAQWNTSVCYPLSWFYVLLPLPWSLNYFCLGHLLLAGSGMYLLARHWTGNPFAASIAGLAYALNGLAFNCLMWTSNLAALAWFPFVVLYVSRGWTQGGRMMLGGILAASMQMLAGAPETVLVTWLLLGTLWLVELRNSKVPFKRSAIRIGVAISLVCGLSAVQLLPFFELAAHSDRTAGGGNAAWSMPLWGLANFLVPLFHCDKTILGTYIQVDQQWTSSYYVGVGVIALAIIGAWKARSNRVWWLGGVAIAGILLALGEHGFIYPIAKRVFPLFGLIRYPIKFIVLTIFALPLLAAAAINWASTQRPEVLRRTFNLPAGILLCFTILILAVSRFSPAPDEVWKTTLLNGLGRIVFLLLALTGLLLIGKASSTTAKRWLGFGLLALVGLDAMTHTSRQNPTVPNVAYSRLEFDMKPLPKTGESRAVVSPRTQAILSRASLPDPLRYYVGNRKSLFENCNLIEGLPKVNGFFSLHLREQAAVNDLIYQPTNYPSGLFDFVGASQLSSDDDFWKWVPRPTAMPLITGGQKPIFADRQETLGALASPNFNPREITYLPKDISGKLQTTGESALQIQRTEFSAHRISASVKATTPSLVVVAQNHYPAWKAFVDGHATPIFRANHAFQALEVPAGKHEILLAYRDTAFYVGAAITGVSLLLCAALFSRRTFPIQLA
jgi:hypothetical protein